MDPDHALHAQPRSMSCEFELGAGASDARGSSLDPDSLETAINTVLPPTSHVSPVTRTPSHTSPECQVPPLESLVPLPPSPPGSEANHQELQELGSAQNCQEHLPQGALPLTSTYETSAVEDWPLPPPLSPELAQGQSTLVTRDEGILEDITLPIEEEMDEDKPLMLPIEEGPGLRSLGIPSDEPEGQNTPTQDVTQWIPLRMESVLAIFRRNRREAERCASLKRAAYNQLHQHGSQRKLAPVLIHRYQQLVRCHREDYSSEFVRLFTELPDAKTGAVPPAASKPEPWYEGGDDNSRETAQWMNRLKTSSCERLLRLVTLIRSDDEFLFTRIARLPSSMLDYLCRLHYHHSTPLELSGGLGNPFGGMSSRPPSRMSNMSEPFDSLDDIQRNPLHILTHSIFDWTQGPDSVEGLCRENLWASVCAKMVSQDVYGADRLIIAVLNEFALTEPWAVASQFETLVLEWIQSGFFILDPDVVPSHRNESEEVRQSRIAVAQTRFLETALERLLHLLTKNLDQSIPVASLNLCRSILAKVQPSKRERTRHLLVTGWYCQVFLQSTLLCPENHCILGQQHVRRDARMKILHGVYTRLVSTFEAAGVQQETDGNFASALAITGVQKIIDTFEQPRHLESLLKSDTPRADIGAPFLSLTTEDALSTIRVLFPHVDKSPELSGGSVFGRAFSTTSSILGGSRATTTGTLTPMFGTRSSFAPSTSSTSITSDTFFSENAVGVDAVSVGMSEGTSMPFTPGGSINGIDEQAQYSALIHEILSLNDPISSKQARDAKRSGNPQSKILSRDVSILFVGGNDVYLQEPRPGESSARVKREPDPASDAYDQAPLYDVLQLVMSEMTAGEGYEACEKRGPEEAVYSIGKYLSCRKRQAQDGYDFVAAHRFHQSSLVYDEASLEQKQSLLQALIDQALEETNEDESRCEMYRSWVDGVKAKEAVTTKRIHQTMSGCRVLRDKQWFSSVACHSVVYRDSSNTAKALATMATGKPAKQGGLAGWAKRKLKASFGSERAQAQSLALLATKRQYGGPNKLTDSQAELTANWLSNNKVENFCSGEERVHRFCYEIKRCTQKLVADSMIASPVLWSSNLYEKEKIGFGGLQSQQQRPSWNSPSASSSPTPPQGGFSQTPSAQANASKIFPFSLSPPHSRQATGVRDFASLQAPQKPRQSVLDPSFRFSTTPENALGLQTPWALPPSPVSPSLASTSQEQPKLSPQQAEFLNNLRKSVTSLLLSDLGLLLWTNGTETDRWVNEERLHHESISVKIGSLSHPNLTQLARSPPKISTADPGIELYRWQREVSEEPESQKPSDESTRRQTTEPFPYKDAYIQLLTKFRLRSDPTQKLEALHELVRLISLAPSMPDEEVDRDSHDLASLLRSQYASGLPNRSLPRTRLTKLQEVTINCEERRTQSLVMTPLPSSPPVDRNQPWIVSRSYETASSGEDIGDFRVSQVIRALLLDRTFYPESLFRDLQMISAFVPSAYLDSTPQGTSFWTLSLAAMQLKSTLCAAMIDRAAQITNFHVDRGNKAREPVRQDRIGIERSNSSSYPDTGATSTDATERRRTASPNRNYQSRTLSEAELKSTSLADAGRLFQIAAAEGDPAAARELGLFYLTHPEHVRRALIPLSKPSEVESMARAAPGQPERSGGIGANPYARKAEASSTRSRTSQLGDYDDEMSLDDPEASPDGRDPSNLATAWHWMEFAAGGGDEQANTFLAGNAELH